MSRVVVAHSPRGAWNHDAPTRRRWWRGYEPEFGTYFKGTDELKAKWKAEWLEANKLTDESVEQFLKDPNCRHLHNSDGSQTIVRLSGLALDINRLVAEKAKTEQDKFNAAVARVARSIVIANDLRKEARELQREVEKDFKAPDIHRKMYLVRHKLERATELEKDVGLS